MDVRETVPSTAFVYEEHPLLHQRVRDPKTDREGELMAVVCEPLGQVAGRRHYTRTAYVRAANGLEFTVAPDTLVRL
ncbi:hypothetical protein OHS33_17105 [Streptomyces sp. NBC_00536]|uniref:hypothetical protein n=1 Tax=Streptomyces sp. NBC_00536 TaxID=2975769 RepID=UPI002E824351|nr:hypothetical protein [Streptomyces sp. NBC_00536]WUC79902.1 hypothetical protein OHS33_17105 [Streptomyces sp. NBC_00536]